MIKNLVILTFCSHTICSFFCVTSVFTEMIIHYILSVAQTEGQFPNNSRFWISYSSWVALSWFCIVLYYSADGANLIVGWGRLDGFSLDLERFENCYKHPQE